MFKDQREELRRLEAELLLEEEEEVLSPEEEEDWDEEEEWEQPEEPDFPIYNSDRLDADVEDFGRRVCEDSGSIRGRWTAAVLLVLLAVLLLTLAFFLARFVGR